MKSRRLAEELKQRSFNATPGLTVAMLGSRSSRLAVPSRQANDSVAADESQPAIVVDTLSAIQNRQRRMPVGRILAWWGCTTPARRAPLNDPARG